MSLPGFAPLDPATKRKNKKLKERKGSGTPTDAYPTVRALRARQRAQRSTLACRRSTTALPLGLVIAKVRLQAMLPGTWRSADPVTSAFRRQNQTQFVRALPALDLSQSSEHLAAQSVVLGG
jgi:hypothetical protein